jgi:hypothetical protein
VGAAPLSGLSGGSTFDMSLNLPIVDGMTLPESLAAGRSASAELTKASKSPNKMKTLDRRKITTPRAARYKICLLETAEALMFPQALGQHG